MSDVPVLGDRRQKPLFLHDPSDLETRIDFVEYLRTLRKRKWAILAFALVVTLVAGVVAFVSTPIYEAATILMVETKQQKVLTIEDVYNAAEDSREYFQTQLEIMKSREVILKAVAKFKLYDQPTLDPRAPKKGLLAAFIEQLGFSQKGAPTEWTEKDLIQATAGAVSGGLRIAPLRLSQLVNIRFESPDPVVAALVTNAVAQTYIENDLDARYQMTRTASVWLQDRLSGLKENLNKSEQALQDYREKMGIVVSKESSQSGAGSQMGQLQTRLIEARARRAEVEATYKIIKSVSSFNDLASQPVVLNSGQVVEAKRQASEAARRLAETSQRYGKDHPRYVQAESENKSAAENLQRQIELVVSSINHEYELALSAEKTLEAAYAAARGTVQGINRKEFELGVREREVESNRQMYDMFMKRAKETNIGVDLQSVVARVIDRATVPGGPIKPNKQSIIMAALFIGLLAGAMLALLVDLLDNTLKTSLDVESRLKEPVLTVLPMLTSKDADRRLSTRLVLSAPNSIYAEAIRTARTGVLLSFVDIPSRVLLITSSVPGEGKTTFSCNLALAHASTKRTLLIDADMRRASVSKIFDLDLALPGLSELVAGSAEPVECLQHIEGSDLVVLTSGAIPPNPLELLHSDRFTQTLEALAKQFEVIIIDSPPVELVSDALVIATHVTGVIFVTKAQSTPIPLVKKGLRRLKRANGRIVGVALNALDLSKAEKYHGEYSGYGKYGYSSYKSSYGKAYGDAYGQAYGTYGQTYGAEQPPPPKKAT